MKIGIHSIAFGKKFSMKYLANMFKQLNIDFIEIKTHHHPDINVFDVKKGRVNANQVKTLVEMFNHIKIQFHYSDEINSAYTGITGNNDISVQLLLGLGSLLDKYSPGFTIPVHSAYFYSGYINETKEKALENADKNLGQICKHWKYNGKIVLETLPENFEIDTKKWLGYCPKNLEKLIKGREDVLGVCLDIGHLNSGLNNQSTYKDFLHLPIDEIHYHGNYAHHGQIYDSHLLPTPDTIEDYFGFLQFIRTFEGNLNFEVKSRSFSAVKNAIKELRYVKNAKKLMFKRKVA